MVRAACCLLTAQPLVQCDVRRGICELWSAGAPGSRVAESVFHMSSRGIAILDFPGFLPFLSSEESATEPTVWPAKDSIRPEGNGSVCSLTCYF